MTLTASLEVSPEVCPNPVRQPVMVQQWADLAYLHWRVDEREVRDQLPVGLYPDLHEGAAWVGLVPFEMRGLRVRGTPPLPWVRRFVEVNVRTYVRDEYGRPGVWFHSLDASRLGAAVIEVAPGLARTAGPLEQFLSARWGMYAVTRNRLVYGAVSHPPWPLHDAQLLELDDSLVTAAGYRSASGEPHVMWSPGVNVAIGRLRRSGSTSKPTPKQHPDPPRHRAQRSQSPSRTSPSMR